MTSEPGRVDSAMVDDKHGTSESVADGEKPQADAKLFHPWRVRPTASGHCDKKLSASLRVEPAFHRGALRISGPKRARHFGPAI